MSWPSDKPPWSHVQWCQTDPSTWPNYKDINPEWTITIPFPNMGEPLYSLKQQIEDLDSKGEWEFLKRTSNPYELVFSQSHDMRIPYSVCSLRPLSRSYFKMIEILSVLEFFKRHTGKKTHLRSAHVCEGPGGFIEALLSQSTANGSSMRLKDAWAMTLKPSKANIPGWKRAYNFLKKNTLIHVEYGADDTGDIMVPENQKAFLEKTAAKCLIFTADGGFDFSENYSTQEDEVFPLLVSSALIGLQTLQFGGDFVLKVFDTELKATQDLIAMLAYCFDDWTLYKPSLSRPCNAEKYFLGRSSRQIPEWIIRSLSKVSEMYYTNKGNSVSSALNAFMNGSDQYLYGQYIRSILPSIPKDVERDIHNLKSQYLDQQVKSLEYALLHKEEWNKDSEMVWKSIYRHSLEWCSEFKMPIRAVHQVVA